MIKKDRKSTARALAEDVGVFYVWDGRRWVVEHDIDFVFLMAKAAAEFGWTIDTIMDLTPNQLAALLSKLPRINYERAYYMALAFNDPKRMSEELKEAMEENMTEKEKWLNSLMEIREEVKSVNVGSRTSRSKNRHGRF